MTSQQKIDLVVDQWLPMLQNDLRVIVESGCPKHGCGTGPQFTITLACMVACEVVGALSAPVGLTGFAATRAFIERVGQQAHDHNYTRYAGLLFHLFRNGIGHSFLPKQTDGLRARTLWNSPCIDEFGSPAGALVVHNMRDTVHLTIIGDRPVRQFNVVTKILYLDVSRAIGAFAERLKVGNRPIVRAFAVAFDRWVDENKGIPAGSLKQLTATEKAEL